MRYRISAYMDDPAAVWRLKPRQDVFTDNADTAVTTYEAVSRVERCAGAALVHEPSGEVLMSWGYPDPDHPLTAFYAPQPVPPGDAAARPERSAADREGRVVRFPPQGGTGVERRVRGRPRPGTVLVPSAQMEEAVRTGRVVVLARRG